MVETSVQTSDGATLNSGDVQYVYGFANNTIINDGARQVLVPVADGGSRDVIVNVGGVQSVGSPSYHTVLNGGEQSFVTYSVPRSGIEFIGHAYGTVINAGGVQHAQANVYDTIINQGGAQYVTGTAYNTVVNSGGTQFLQSGKAYDTHLMQGGSIVLSANYVNGGTVSLQPASDQLIVNNDGRTFVLDLTGDYSTTSFVLSPTNGQLTVTAQPLCFARGTRILTPCGETSIEDLQPGDDVVTGGGGIRQVRWIGYSAAIVGDRNRPVVVRAGALSEGKPSRDVRVTRHHSFLFGDVLIPVCALVNGASIVWDTSASIVEMFHLALDVHDIVFASGAMAETYRDDGNRSGFHRQSGTLGEPRSMPTYAPVVSRGPIVHRTCRRLAERAFRAETFNPLLSAAASS